MTDEYPKIPYIHDWEWAGYDGEIETGLVVSVESYVGEDGGTQGVKLEQMVQVTRDGPIPLSTFPTGLVPQVG
jgi:Xaa-Pro aminopeptidase